MGIDFIARDADPEMAGDQPVLPVWSIMNGYGDSFGACAPSSLGSPDEAKNLFAVGATRLYSDRTLTSKLFDISDNSAHGPACDGRQVPHIVAPGCSTDSPDSPTGYGFKRGNPPGLLHSDEIIFYRRIRNENKISIAANPTSLVDNRDLQLCPGTGDRRQQAKELE